MIRRPAALLVAFTFVLSATFGLTFGQPAQATGKTDSAVTKRGSGAFADLEVTVGQTRNLVDQIVTIDWKGVAKTVPGSGQYSYNYLQIMQCWGDDENGPDREQCQYGGLTGDDRGGAQAPTRQVSYGPLTVDEAETEYVKDPGSFQQAFVPFESVTGVKEQGSISQFYNAFTTNEVPFAATRGNGTGNDYFAVQTVREAPGLGCGEPRTVAGKTVGRKCWLVVVPRNDREVNGRVATLSDKLISSPLSTSNWNNRLVFPLEFEPAGRACPLGSQERKTIGQENIAEAVLRWQPALCAGGGSVFSFAQVNDDTARRDAVGIDPGLSLVSDPIPAADVKDGSKLVYAPIGISGLTIGFSVDRQTPFSASAAIKERDGERVPTMRLTPRLVAKLLTQSYTRAAHPDAPSVKGNPTDMTKDEEFIALNPEYSGLSISLPELQLPAGRADVVGQVWRWLLADADAAAFLKGTPDEEGYKVNTNYVDLELPRSDYPKSESFCVTATGRPDLCTLDAHPYAGSMQEAARNAARGDFRGLVYWNPNAVPVPTYSRGVPQPSGSRAMLALTDTASAARYGLEVAELKNPSGEFVAPTVASMTSAVSVLGGTAKGVARQPALAGSDDSAYPLTNITYAVADIAALDAAARKDYAQFLAYGAADGQELGLLPGQLPTGYAPLPAAMAAQTKAVSTAVKTGVVPAAEEDDEEKPAPDESDSPTDSGSGGGEGDFDSGSGSFGEELPSSGNPLAAEGDTPTAEVAAVVAAGSEQDLSGTTTVALSTPLDAVGLARLVPLAALVLGLLAALGGALLLIVGRSKGFLDAV